MGTSGLASSTPTFRDPAGSVQIVADGALRVIHPGFEKDVLALLKAPIYHTLVNRGLVVSTEIVTSGSSMEPLTLRHPLIAFRSYSWEWPPSLWLAAAELTLNVCSELLKHGWILKDATPHNVLFNGVRPIFVDVASIQPLDKTTPLWFAYGQFVRAFLLPMLAHAELGWPLQSSMMRRDGFEPEEIYQSLSWSRRLKRPALTSVTIPTFFAGGARGITSRVQPMTVDDPDLTVEIIQKTLSKLRRDMQRTAPNRRQSRWSDYVETAGHYSDQDHAAKQLFIGTLLSECSPTRVLDVGCNSGAYSILAAESGAEVVAIDTDLAAVERLRDYAVGNGKNILPLCVDLAHPTPPAGWDNKETLSFLDRCSGHFDAVLMLAVIHHLLLTSQIPMGHIASLCTRLTTCNLVIEWVPTQDPKYIEILRGRELIYRHITEEAFRHAFAEHFEVVAEETLQNGRILFHLRKR